MLHRLSLALAIVSVVLLVACGSGSSTSGTPSPTPTPVSIDGGATTAAASSTGGVTSQPNGSANGSATPLPEVTGPCSYITQAQVAEATGKPVGPGSNSTDPHECDFEYNDPSDAISLIIAHLTVNVDPKVMTEDEQGSGIFTITPVSDVGDEAYYSVLAGNALLDFRKGDFVYETGLGATGNLSAEFPVDTQEAVEHAMALDAMPSLP